VQSFLSIQPESHSSSALSNQPFELASHVRLDLLRFFPDPLYALVHGKLAPGCRESLGEAFVAR
jgi:hypothetical protein